MMAEVSGKTTKEVLPALKDAGQVSLPGGGAEVLFGICAGKGFRPRKNPDDGWIKVHREAHQLGFKSTATMMYGHVDRPEDWLEHFNRVRDLQDETGGFTAFIPWSFKPGNTVFREEGPWVKARRRISVCSRPHESISIIFPISKPRGFRKERKSARVSALHFGADDFGGTLIDENVHKATGHINTT